MTQQNLWPDFSSSSGSLRSPQQIIKELGKGLHEKTGGIIEFYTGRMTMTNDVVSANFSLYVRSLAYHLPFIIASFPINDFYPVSIKAHKMSEMSALNEEHLIRVLGEIFASPTTRDAVERLMVLSRSL